MKKELSLFVFVLICVLFLCSFTHQKHADENKSLQKECINTASPGEMLGSRAVLSGGDKKSDIDEKLQDIFSEFESLVPEGIPTDTEQLAGASGIGEVIDHLLSALRDGSGVFKNMLMFLGIALLFCLAETLSEDAGDAAPAVRSVSALILSLPILNIGGELIESVGESISHGCEFFAGIIPILSSVAAIGAGGVTAASASATMSFSLSFVSGVLLKHLFSVATLIFAVSLLSGIDTGQGLTQIAKGTRGWFNFLIGISSLMIVATLGAQTLIAASKDSLTLRSARYAISNMIPIVGGTVSGALSMLISGVKLLSGSIGVISVAVLLSFMAAPLISLLIYRLCIGACVVLTSFSGASFGERFFSSLRGAVDCLIATLASSLLVFMLEVIILTVNLSNLI